MVLRVKILVLVMFLIVCTKLWAQDEIFVSGFEPVPELFLDASPETISQGESTTITWSVIDADNCIKSGDWSGIAMAGTGIYNQAVTPATLPATYSMQCSNFYGNSPIRTVVVEEEFANPPTLVFTANPTEVAFGQSTTLTWTVADATSCVAGVDSGGATGWGGSVSSSDGTHNRVVSLTALPTQLRLTCFNHVGQADKTVTIVESGPNNPPTLTLVANPTSIIQGDSTTLTWTVNDADGCTATNGWSGSKPYSNGQHNQVITGITETTTYSLTCYNSFGSVMKNVTVNVTSEPVNCGSNQPPVGTVRFTGVTTFEQAMGSEFGNFTSDLANYLQPVNSYSALEFYGPNGIVTGRVSFEPPLASHPPAVSTSVSISACPGDFNPGSVIGNCKVGFGNSGTLRWTTNPSAHPALYCILEPGTSYYLNIIHAELNDLENSSCSYGSGCGLLFIQQEN
ncbi:MAG: hypothetical protein KDI92_11515 [Xanthomonadales bacterium]|nr:hypothetical protein [Xanthomonadales bacterium]